MNIREYISSGILELYASGSLPENEENLVEEIIRKNPEIKEEYEKIQRVIYLSASLYLKAPSEKVKVSLLDKISGSDKIQSKESSYGKLKRYYRYLMAASIVFLLVSLVTNFFLWTKLKDAKNEITVISDQKKLVVQNYEAVNRKLSKASEDMQIMKDRDYKMVDLKGMEISPSSSVVAFWNPENKKVYVEVMNLPVPPSGKQYQLWALSNGKPIDAGVMDVDPSDKSLHQMKSMDDAQAFAITLEPKGGSVNPTMEQMYAMGKIF